MRKIVKLKYKDGESIAENINTFMGYVNQLAATKFPLDDAMQAILLMCTVPDSSKNLVVTLSTSCQEENLSIQVVKTSILNEESRRKDKSVISVRVKCDSTYPDRGRNNKEVQRGEKSPMQDPSPGHFQKDSRHLKKDKGVSNDVEPRKISEEKGTSVVAASEEEILFICEQARANLASEACTWVIGSSASFHITPLRECFSTYIAGDHGYIKMGDNGECRIVGVGNVCLTTSTRCQLTLKDVRHFLDIRLNLISTGRTDDEGYSGSFRNGKWNFCQENLIVARA